MQQAINILNFEKILASVETMFIFEMSKEYKQDFLTVEKTYELVSELQQFTETFYTDQAKFSLPEFLPLHSFSVIKKKIEREQVLDIKECLQVLHLYQNVQTLKLFYQKQEALLTDKQRIDLLLGTMLENETILKAIKKIIANNGSILDTASAKLQTIRQDQKAAEQSVRTTLQQIMQTERTKLAENLFTIRNNRYVLPIKAEYKNNFSGILHDQSASGTTFYIEPQSLVNINNRLQQLELEERHEIERILLELSQNIFAVEAEITQNIWSLARFDIYAAKATYAYQNNLAKVIITPQPEITLYDAKHPLLNTLDTIGNDIILGHTYQTLMITGANTGGKSVFLKTIGMLALMAQTGLFLPINRDKDNKIGVFTDVFIDIGDEQSLEQNLSTFSGHIKNMKTILTHSGRNSLVLLDELGSGTDPIQGSALAIAMLEKLHTKGALVVGTTHFNEVKEFIVKADYAENAAMVFDVESLTPTYKIRYGSYGASYAFDIAKALQLPQDIIETAKIHAESYADHSQELLSVYEQRLKSLDDLAKDLAEKELDLEKQTISLNKKLQHAEREIERKRKEVIATSEQELADKINKVNELLADMKTKKDLKQNEHASIKGALNTLGQSKHQAPNMQLPKSDKPLQEGDVVYVQNLQSNGTLQKKSGSKWLVKVGNLSMTLSEKDLIFVKTTKQKPTEVRNVRKSMRAVPAKLDLRGFRVLEGIEALETYLANASSSHDVVRIVHGHGTGSMRDAVQQVLRKNKQVKSFRFGGEGEGGVGATIVEFK